VNAEGFLADVVAEPEALRRVAEHHGAARLERLLERPRVLFIGMGSSRFAAMTAVADLRSQGVDAHAELASTGSPQPPSAGTVCVAISASGSSAETLDAIRRHRRRSTVVALTNAPLGELAALADVSVDVLAGPEKGGVACRSFACTQAVLALMRGVSSDRIRRAADAVQSVIEERRVWLDDLAGLAEEARGVWVAAPAERIGTAEQSALMLREVPRIRADACETGDWSHVDVYLSKLPGLGLVLLRGSAWEAEVLEWAGSRGCPVVTVGGPLPGAALDVPVPGGDDPIVRMLAEVRVCELLAADLHNRHGDRLSM
jgi:fructoselysine-6-P-deglycase FrlB-like protein